MFVFIYLLSEWAAVGVRWNGKECFFLFRGGNKNRTQIAFTNPVIGVNRFGLELFPFDSE